MKDRDVKALKGVVDYIHEHYNEKLNTKILSTIACMCETKFKCCFRQLYGKTAFQYVRSVRVAEAMKLLEANDLPVAEVARTVGYCKPRTFVKAFRDHTKFLPKQYKDFCEAGGG